MSGEALAAALRGPRDASGRAYRELVESLITEAEVDGVQERGWQHQRRSQLRIAELEAREDERAGRVAPTTTSYEQSAEDEGSVRRTLNDDSGQAPLASSEASSAENNSLLARETGGRIRALEAELALSIEREQETVQKLRECGPLLSADFGEPTFGRHPKVGRAGRESNRTESDTSDWETESESNSQDSTPLRRRSQKAPTVSEDEAFVALNRVLSNSGTDKSGAVSNGEMPAERTAAAEPQNAGVTGSGKASEVLDDATFSEDLRPRSPGSWEEVAQVKAEQLEEAKLLLTAVMEGERAALETVARLELELQVTREEKLEVERKGAEAAAIASAQIEALSAIVEESVRRLREKDGVNGDRWDEGWGFLWGNEVRTEDESAGESAGRRTREEGVRLCKQGVRTDEESVRSGGRVVQKGEESISMREVGVRTSKSSVRGSPEAKAADSRGNEDGDSESSGTSATESVSGADGLRPSAESSKKTPGRRASSSAPDLGAVHEAGPLDDLDHSDRSDADGSEPGRRVSTVEELRVREAAYRTQCEELQQQVRRALEQVEALRNQQSEREVRAAAAYEARLSAYVKQMVGVQRENEELRGREKAHQMERERLQEQLDADHEKRRNEFHAAEARVESLSESLRELSDRLLERTFELQRTRLRTLKASNVESQDDVSRALPGGEGLRAGRGKGKSSEEVSKSCRAVMREFEREADEVEEAMERTAEMGRELEERTAEMGRRLEERTAQMSRELEEWHAHFENLVAERDHALEKIGNLVAEKRELEGVKRERDEALARERVLLVELKALEGVRVEKGKAVEDARGLRAQVVDLERVKVDYMKRVADLESRLREQESSLAHYKAEIQEELAGLAEHMHVAAAERAREDAEYRNRTEERARTLRTREDTIGRLENEVRTRTETMEQLENEVRTRDDTIERLETAVRTLRTQEETIGRLENGVRTGDEVIGRLENEVRELKQQLWNERELSESVRQRLRATDKSEGPSERGGEEFGRNKRGFEKRVEVGQSGAKTSEGIEECPECGERGSESVRGLWIENDKLRGEKRRFEDQAKAREAETEHAMRREETRVERLNGKVLELIDERESFAQALNEDTRRLVDESQARGAEVQRLTVLLNEQEEKVGELEGTVKKLLDEKELLQLELARSHAGMEVIGSQGDFLLRAKQEQVDALTQKVERLELEVGGKSEGDWDAVQKEKMIAEVQDILEQYSMAGEESARWERSTEREAEANKERNFESEGTVAASDGSERSLEGSEERVLSDGRRESDGPEVSEDARGFDQPRGVQVHKNERRSEMEGPGANVLGKHAGSGTEERVRTGVQAAPSGNGRQAESVRRTLEAEIARLREKVRLLEERQGPFGEERTISVEHGGFSSTSERIGTAPFGSREATRESETVGMHTGTTVGESVGALAGAVNDGLAGQNAGSTVPPPYESARLSPGERQSSDSGQARVWSDKRPTGEEGTPSKQGLVGAVSAAQASQRASHDEAKLVEDNASLRLKVAELRESNRELQLRVKVLEDDRSKLLDKIASSQGPVFSPDAEGRIESQAAEIAALQAQLAEAAARLTEQRGRYKHLKGKYLRQLARQQAMHEYMLQGGESPANLSPRSGVAPSVGRPRPSVDEAKPPSDAPTTIPPRNEANGRVGTWPEPWSDLGPGQRQGMVARNSQRRWVGAEEQAVPYGHSSLRHSSDEAPQNGQRRSDLNLRSEGSDSGQRQNDGRENAGGRRETLDEVPERGPSSIQGQPGADTRFSKWERGGPASSRGVPPNASSQRAISANAYGQGRHESRLPSPYGSRASSRRPSRTDSVATHGGIPSGRQSRADSAPTHSRLSSRRSSQADSAAALSGIPVGLRVLMDGRPLPGFPAKVEDLGGYFAEARAQSDGANSSAKLPFRRASSPYVYRTAERRTSRASSAPPMRPRYNRSIKVWV
ncbi:hypothetical protein KFL_004300040 [Klebsormidium nitens]|uniref:Uncharacterized protein n=1 Tax=Klebsormidium nitens TaxID=105231 RepID=A0A1Y1ICY5_KLENI|nr:hypothetical protein KFL_004300040 [Klebsormidium nitens]|eukprot:GAQ88453.1 hypothetical protein KFL_004300040 [Klebsormidium nitens]